MINKNADVKSVSNGGGFYLFVQKLINFLGALRETRRLFVPAIITQNIVFVD